MNGPRHSRTSAAVATDEGETVDIEMKSLLPSKASVDDDRHYHHDDENPATITSSSSTLLKSMDNVDDNDLKARHSDGGGGGRRDLSQALWKYAVLHILQIGNVLLWYYTNGMNGIAMQSFAKTVKDYLPSTSSTLQFLSTLQITSFVTYRQLLLGAFIGYVLLLLLDRHKNVMGNTVVAKSITIFHLVQWSHWWPLSSLHAVGSLATNVGFMYGKASVIQVIKLLEPFETLLLSQLLFSEGNCSIGVVSSMSVVVGAAMSLLTLQSKPPLPQAVVAAVASGLTLSCRNVLQRKHHHHHSTTTRGGTIKPVTPTNGSVPAAAAGVNNPPHNEPKTPIVSLQDLTKLEKSILQFTQLSFYSCLWTGALSLLLWLVIVMPSQGGAAATPSISSMATTVTTTTTTTTRTNSTPMQVFLWHPLYNVFSMITLGFCSALTHSLLNAGKRVFAICMAMLWFREGLDNPATLAALFLVGMGGSWYSAESKGAAAKSSGSGGGSGGSSTTTITSTGSTNTSSHLHKRPWPLLRVVSPDSKLRPFLKLAAAIMLLGGLLRFQSIYGS